MSKIRVSYQILGILCEIPGGVFMSFNVCPHVVFSYPTRLGTTKVTSVGTLRWALCSPPILSPLPSHYWVCAGASEAWGVVTHLVQWP